MGMNLSKLQEIVKDRGAWYAELHGVAKCQTCWMTEQQPGQVSGKDHEVNYAGDVFLLRLSSPWLQS